MRWITGGVLAVALLLAPARRAVAQGPTHARIVDDPALDAAIAAVRAEFLARENFHRLDCCLLLPEPDGSFRRGSYGLDTLAYPASCVKLAYLVTAMRWERLHARTVDALDRDVRPMITVSDNEATGRVVDAITGTPNLPSILDPADARLPAWIEGRRAAERYLALRGLLGHQTILHKTYPSNSGEAPTGAEKAAREARGGNRMCPGLAAELMAGIVRGWLEPQATSYMRALLAHDRLGEFSAVGFGLPPGSVYENKIGDAYDTAEDIAHVVLPNGRELFLAIFTDSLDHAQPEPYDSDRPGYFTERLLDRLRLTDGCPPRVVVTADDPGFDCSAGWARGQAAHDRRGQTYMQHVCASASALITRGTAPEQARATWHLSVPETGIYEVAVWYPQATDRTAAACYSVTHASGILTRVIDQRLRGGRWIVLGNVPLTRGGGLVTLTASDPAAPSGAAAPDAAVTVCIADAVRATMFPRGAGTAPVGGSAAPTQR